MVSVDETRSCSVEFRPLDVVRWDLVTIDVSNAVSVDDLLALCSTIESAHDAADGRILALRLVLSGQTSLHDSLLAKRHYITNEIRSIASDVSSGDVWLEKIGMDTTSSVSPGVNAIVSDDAKSEIITLFQEAMSDRTVLEGLGFDLADAEIKKLPAELKDSSHARNTTGSSRL